MVFIEFLLHEEVCAETCQTYALYTACSGPQVNVSVSSIFTLAHYMGPRRVSST
jgi:hypothetical protein